METLSLKLPKELSVQLEAAAKRRKASKKAIVRAALEKYLAQEEPLPPGSFAALTKEFIGCLDGGPPDLSHNKKHMEGFGK